MNIDDVKVILYSALSASRILEKSIRTLHPRQSDLEAQQYRRAVGAVLAVIGEELIDPVFVLFPEMEPEGEEGWRKLRQELGDLP
jgi:hypothetical protein